MASFDLSLDGIPPALEPTAKWASALAWALARDEAAGRRPARLTEDRRATWERFKGRLTAPDFLALLFEDAAVGHPVPFDAERLGRSMRLAQLPPSVVDAWLEALAAPPESADYVAEQAKRLGLPSRMARSDLHVVKPHQKVLELPGTGGQLAHHIVHTQGDVTLQDNFLVACEGWEELTLAGVVGLDLAAPDSGFALPVSPGDLQDPEHAIRKQTFDFVVGLDPKKGGTFQVENQLEIWFSSAKVVLV